MILDRSLLAAGALMGFLAVAIGAFGAHMLKQKLSTDMLAVFEIGVRYQMYHALAICLTAIIASGWAPFAGWTFFLGIVIFSGSLYILALTGIRSWGAITPIGGVILLAGWVFLLITALKI